MKARVTGRHRVVYERQSQEWWQVSVSTCSRGVLGTLAKSAREETSSELVGGYNEVQRFRSLSLVGE